MRAGLPRRAPCRGGSPGVPARFSPLVPPPSQTRPHLSFFIGALCKHISPRVKDVALCYATSSPPPPLRPASDPLMLALVGIFNCPPFILNRQRAGDSGPARPNTAPPWPGPLDRQEERLVDGRGKGAGGNDPTAIMEMCGSGGGRPTTTNAPARHHPAH